MGVGSPPDHERKEVDRVLGYVSGRVAMAHGLDAEDARHEAWIALSETLHRYRPEKAGAGGLVGYLTRAAWRFLTGWARLQASPISGKRQDYRAVFRAGEDALDFISDDLDVESMLADADWIAVARQAIDLALAEFDAEEREQMERVMMGESEIAEVAAELGIPASWVQRRLRHARIALTSSPEVHTAWKKLK